MTEYERGFNEGFAAAVQRMEHARSAIGPSIAADFNGHQAKISIGFRPDQFTFIKDMSAALACSFASAVRRLIDQNMQARREGGTVSSLPPTSK